MGGYSSTTYPGGGINTVTQGNAPLDFYRMLALAATPRRSEALPVFKQNRTAQGSSDEQPTYVKNISGFNMTPGAVQVQGGDPGAVFGGYWQKGASPSGGGGGGGRSAPDFGPTWNDDYMGRMRAQQRGDLDTNGRGNGAGSGAGNYF